MLEGLILGGHFYLLIWQGTDYTYAPLLISLFYNWQRESLLLVKLSLLPPFFWTHVCLLFAYVAVSVYQGLVYTWLDYAILALALVNLWANWRANKIKLLN